MKFENIKIQPAEISAKGVSSAPDRLSGTAAENKAVFDRLIKDVVAEKFNGFVDLVRDEIEAIDLPPAGEPGYTPVKGVDYWTDEDKGEMEADVLATLREGELSEIESNVADVSDELCRLEETLAGFSDKTLSIGFTVHGGTSAPEAAGEGEVWINTATPISGWAYSSAEPVNPEEGKVWLIAGEGIALDTLVNGNIAICPAGAKQYVGGVWTAVEGRINRGGEWAATEPPCIYLYNNGDECVDVSGGFVSHAYKPNGISSTSVIAPVLSKNADSMDISLAVYYYGAVFSSASLALDDVATIEVVYSSASGSGLSFLVTQTSGQHYAAEARATPEGSSGTATIDVSGLSGKYYFVTEIAATGGAVTIHEIRMNKSASSGVGVRPGSGENVFSPVVDVTAITNGHRVTITDAAGVETFDVMNGETGAAGRDYVLTAADKTEIAEQAAALVPGGGGGVPSWNDLADKPFGEDENAVLLPPTQFAFDNAFQLFAVPGYIDFMIGKTYTVNWNGVEYTTEGVAGQFNGENLVMIGNPAALGGANNNLPFAIACLLGSIGAIPLDGSTAVNVGIKGYFFKKIPGKCMARYDLHLERMYDELPEADENGQINLSFDTTELVDAVLDDADIRVFGISPISPDGYAFATVVMPVTTSRSLAEYVELYGKKDVPFTRVVGSGDFFFPFIINWND